MNSRMNLETYFAFKKVGHRPDPEEGIAYDIVVLAGLTCKKPEDIYQQLADEQDPLTGLSIKEFIERLAEMKQEGIAVDQGTATDFSKYSSPELKGKFGLFRCPSHKYHAHTQPNGLGEKVHQLPGPGKSASSE